MSEKHQLKKKKIIGLFVILIISIFLIYKVIDFTEYYGIQKQLRELNYTKEGAKLLFSNKLDSYVLKNNIYSKTLEVALIEGEYDREYLSSYIDIKYKDDDKYIKHLNQLKKIGYKDDEISIILCKLKSSDVDVITSRKTVVSDLSSYVIDEYFEVKNLDRYIEYKNKNPKYSYETVIDYVNINLDYPFYGHVTSVKDSNSTLVLVNKYYKLDDNFVPKNLVSLPSNCTNSSDNKVTSTVKNAFSYMCSDMRSIGLTIKAISTYRSYKTQEELYNNYVKRDGVKVADTYSARPGYSEHQTGLALDVNNGAIAFTSFDQTDEYTWVRNNAYRYGFIIRYQKDKENITGYRYEPWHLRYVGIEVATYIHSKNITFDEYYAKFLDK